MIFYIFELKQKEQNLGIFSIMREKQRKYYWNWNGGHLRCTTWEDLLFKATLMLPNLHMTIPENTVLLKNSTFMVLEEAEINTSRKQWVYLKTNSLFTVSYFWLFGPSIPTCFPKFSNVHLTHWVLTFLAFTCGKIRQLSLEIKWRTSVATSGHRSK